MFIFLTLIFIKIVTTKNRFAVKMLLTFYCRYNAIVILQRNCDDKIAKTAVNRFLHILIKRRIRGIKNLICLAARKGEGGGKMLG
jgi:hypothetical protein